MLHTHYKGFRHVAKKRAKTVKHLIDAGDFEGAAYLLGLTGEIALKAVICKLLDIDEYPPASTTANQRNYLKTHDHQELLVLSGLSKAFNPATGSPEAQNWSDYTTHYKGDWISRLRYNDKGDGLPVKLTDKEVLGLYDALIADKNSILNYIVRKRLW